MENKKVNDDSRDYSFDMIEDDPRLKRTTKEFFITMGTYIVYAALMILNLFTFGRHSGDYPKIFGFPLWIFILICLLIGMVITVELICTYVYKDMDLTSEPSEEEEIK